MDVKSLLSYSVSLTVSSIGTSIRTYEHIDCVLCFVLYRYSIHVSRRHDTYCMHIFQSNNIGVTTNVIEWSCLSDLNSENEECTSVRTRVHRER